MGGRGGAGTVRGGRAGAGTVSGGRGGRDVFYPRVDVWEDVIEALVAVMPRGFLVIAGVRLAACSGLGMALRLTSMAAIPCSSTGNAIRKMKPRLQEMNVWSPYTSNSLGRGRERCIMLSALPETAVSIVVAAVVVGASATMLRRMTEASSKTDSPTEMCKDCEGSGLCTVCNGEGFVLKQLSEEKAEKARMTATNMATRYTAGLPKKWSYCYKCSSTRSCRTCGGSGQFHVGMDVEGLTVKEASEEQL
ncbi:hypothetical protein Taro_011184 [Colocasia esculenta]|uniref:DUF7895 domain-containing protein n=1 Tax=Colocasia esculenta TaxID=4460 RepID=A0A843U0X9_COLES|nr:hypothetical protein [Colocasia esculenta]